MFINGWYTLWRGAEFLVSQQCSTSNIEEYFVDWACHDGSGGFKVDPHPKELQCDLGSSWNEFLFSALGLIHNIHRASEFLLTLLFHWSHLVSNFIFVFAAVVFYEPKTRHPYIINSRNFSQIMSKSNRRKTHADKTSLPPPQGINLISPSSNMFNFSCQKERERGRINLGPYCKKTQFTPAKKRQRQIEGHYKEAGTVFFTQYGGVQLRNHPKGYRCSLGL